MMKRMMIYTLLLTMVAAVGCKENEIALYDQSPRLEFAGMSGGSAYSVLCTFDDTDYLNAYVLGGATEKEYETSVQVIGMLLDTPRTFCVQSQPHEESAFDVGIRCINPGSVAAGSSTASAHIAVTCPDRTKASSRNRDVTGISLLTFDTSSPSHQFEPGREEHMSSRVFVTLQVYPSDWNSEQWGLYSSSKYILMMETFKTVHSQIPRTTETLLEIRRAYLLDYKPKYGPLYGDDERSDEEITFPQP